MSSKSGLECQKRTLPILVVLTVDYTVPITQPQLALLLRYVTV